MADPHDDSVRSEFERQSRSFSAAGSFFGLDDVSEWVAARLPLNPESVVLDLAGGAGHLSRALSSRAARFVVLDLTPSQLAIGREAVERDGIDNVEFVEGDATATPFADGEFALVMSRFALHHMTDPVAAVGEAGRVCRAGGYVALADLVSPDGELDEPYNELERIRDPSHTRGLTRSEFDDLAASNGEIVAADQRDYEFAVEPWMERSATPEEGRREIRDRLAAELSGGESTGMRPRETPGGLVFSQSWRLAVVQKP